MGLPVHQIIAALEDQMIDLEEEGVDDVQGGPEVEDEEATEEDLIPDLSGVQVELVDSSHEGTKWLIVNGIHICHKQKEWPEEVNSGHSFCL